MESEVQISQTTVKIDQNYIVKSKWDKYVDSLVNSNSVLEQQEVQQCCKKICIYREDGNVVASNPKDFKLDEYNINEGESKTQVYNEYFELMKILQGVICAKNVTINKISYSYK